MQWPYSFVHSSVNTSSDHYTYPAWMQCGPSDSWPEGAYAFMPTYIDAHTPAQILGHKLCIHVRTSTHRCMVHVCLLVIACMFIYTSLARVHASDSHCVCVCVHVAPCVCMYAQLARQALVSTSYHACMRLHACVCAYACACDPTRKFELCIMHVWMGSVTVFTHLLLCVCVPVRKVNM